MKILVTGASSGIGKSLVELLLRNGHQVFGLARRKQLLDEIKRRYPKNFDYAACDVGSHKEVFQVKKRMASRGFFPDVIIAGAGIYPNDARPKFKIETFKQVFDVNLFGAINLADAFLGDLLKRGRGHFIALSSVAALRPNKRGIAYPASKAALSLAFRGFDLEYRKRNVMFSTIYLGPVETEMWEGKKSFLVPKPENIARQISKVLKTKKSTYFMPFLSTFLFRLSLLLPDKLYNLLTGILK